MIVCVCIGEALPWQSVKEFILKDRMSPSANPLLLSQGRLCTFSADGVCMIKAARQKDSVVTEGNRCSCADMLWGFGWWGGLHTYGCDSKHSSNPLGDYKSTYTRSA